ncbi:hypothetical protein ACFOOL_12900 [Devosia honganensis]|uniref:KfrA N-terminal DNA-binding domain-containing protein n=1 Tax=Devosia honganensis TaxID=1610527 RepID=A0ABV7X4U9_9HYPH
MTERLVDAIERARLLGENADTTLSAGEVAAMARELQSRRQSPAETFQKYVDANEARLDAEQQVQKLSAENERLREALKVSRHVLAKLLSAGHNNPPATPEEIDAAFWSVDAALTQEGER